MITNSSAPKILHLIDTGGPGGAETVFAELARHGADLKINAAIAVPYDGWLADHLRTQGLQPTILPSKGAAKIEFAARLFNLARSSGATIIVAHLLGAGVYGSLIGMFRQMPVLSIFHGDTDLRSPGTLAPIKRWLLRRTHVTPVAVSEPVAASLVRWGVDGSRIHLIRNGVDTRKYLPVGSGSLHSELNLPPTCPIVGAVGNIRPAKDYPVLIRAAKIVVSRHASSHFVIAGSGSATDSADLERLATELGISDRVHLLGFRSSCTDLYRSLSVMASSANTEGLPLSFLEAMSCGIPIAATSNDGSARLIAETSAGLLSPVGDPHALAASILQILESPALADSLARRGMDAARSRYSLEQTLEQYQALYADVSRPTP